MPDPHDFADQAVAGSPPATPWSDHPLGKVGVGAFRKFSESAQTPDSNRS
jgi:hypothetical protein